MNRELLFLAMPIAILLTGLPAATNANDGAGYRLAAGDVLGIFVEGVIGEVDQSPPVHYPEADSDLAPSIGFPTVVRTDGTLTLPLIEPISVAGLTIEQAEARVIRAYRGTRQPIIKVDSRVIVTLARKRTISVLVVRQDSPPDLNTGARLQSRYLRGVTDRSDFSARGGQLQLPAGDNDLLTALIRTGGLPGLNAKPTVRIVRKEARSTGAFSTSNGIRSRSGSSMSTNLFPRTNRTGGKRPGTSPPPRRAAGDYATFYRGPAAPHTNSNQREFRVPVRGIAGATDRLNDVRLSEGDIVYVDSLPTEVYYTGGLLRGGEHPLPRDKPLDALEAVAISGGALGGNAGVIAGSVPPTELLVVRKSSDGRQRTFVVNTDRSLGDPSQRVTVAAGDTLILRYKPVERLQNAGIRAFNTFGIQRALGQ